MSQVVRPRTSELLRKTETLNGTRYIWDYDELTALQSSPDTIHSRAFDRLKNIIRIRTQQKAFHPNATQFTLHFEQLLFAFWRQSQDRSQSIFCIFNVTNRVQKFTLKDVNLIELDDWHDLISGHAYDNAREDITLEPYSFVLISNK